MASDTRPPGGRGEGPGKPGGPGPRGSPERPDDPAPAEVPIPEDWSPAELADALERAAAFVLEYRAEVVDGPVLSSVRPGDVHARLAGPPPERPAPFAAVLEDVRDIIVPGLTHWNHPGFLAYFSSSARGPSIAAELVIAGLGVNAMLWRTSPAATEVELVAIEWLREAVGLPATFRGVILDTASTSTFTALLAARERAGDVRELGLAGGPELTAYASEQAHSSVEKAAMAAGLGRRSVRRVPVDDAFRLRPDALAGAIEADVAEGRRPAFVCATIGTTSTGSADPVGPICRIAREHGAWVHVDAAWAGPSAMLPELRPIFSGWEDADSVVINPHKWMGTSLDCSVLLFRDPDAVRRSLSLTPAYLETDDRGAVNLMEYGLPLGRRFRGLKLWTLFRCVGTEGLQRTFRRHIGLAEGFEGALRETGAYEIAAPTSFATCCFRLAPAAAGASDRGPDGDRRDDLRNRALLARTNADGRVFLSHTELDGRYTLRLSVGGVRSGQRQMEEALDALERARAELETEGFPAGSGSE